MLKWVTKIKQPKITYEHVDKFLNLVTNDECWKWVFQILSSKHVLYTFEILVWWGKISIPTQIGLFYIHLPYHIACLAACILLDLVLILCKCMSTHAS